MPRKHCIILQPHFDQPSKRTVVQFLNSFIGPIFRLLCRTEIFYQFDVCHNITPFMFQPYENSVVKKMITVIKPAKSSIYLKKYPFQSGNTLKMKRCIMSKYDQRQEKAR